MKRRAQSEKMRKMVTFRGSIRTPTIMDLLNDSPWIEHAGLRYKLVALKALLVQFEMNRKNKFWDY